MNGDGWAANSRAQKVHYYYQGKALCEIKGRAELPLIYWNAEHPDTCRKCRNLLTWLEKQNDPSGLNEPKATQTT